MAKKAKQELPPPAPYIPPTPEEKVRTLVQTLKYKITGAENTLLEFSNKFLEHPTHSLVWSHSVFTAAARQDIFKKALECLMDNDGNPVVSKPAPGSSPGLHVDPVTNTYNTTEWLKTYATDEVISKANHPSRSTSVTSNLMDQEILSAWAEVLDIIKWH